MDDNYDFEVMQEMDDYVIDMVKKKKRKDELTLK